MASSFGWTLRQRPVITTLSTAFYLFADVMPLAGPFLSSSA
jgi:hypothetical protein